MTYTNFKEIDKAGRIVISKDIRKHLDIEPNDMLHISCDDNIITIKKAEKMCTFCGSTENLLELNGKYVCKECIDKLKNNS